jgi:hypothetical protein
LPPALALLAPGVFTYGARDMAKKKDHGKCSNPKCLNCRWWPKVVKNMGEEQGCYWVNFETGELFIATGWRAMPDGSLVEIPEGEGSPFYEVECECGAFGHVRGDILEQGLMESCPRCAAMTAQIARN